nr:PREDICTED: protein FAM173A isoform X1 [Anolis carolinensis]XP_008119239.1 PREDICTED: protein FAM173A isoform X1 [Anolis carolinensis]|eukprot:XP_008119238.1 PREDICTED: protein FAM173A isoform X1 [Anolis carolinensis]
MNPEDAGEAAAELQGKTVDGWGLLQIAAGTGLTAYVVWAGILMPGFRKVPLKLQVPYVPASIKQVENVMSLLKGRSGKMVDLGSGDGRIVLEAYKQGFRPAIGYELNPWLLRRSGYHAWKAGCYGKVSFLREDLWKVDLSDCKNVTVFLAPSVLFWSANILELLIFPCVETDKRDQNEPSREDGAEAPTARHTLAGLIRHKRGGKRIGFMRKSRLSGETAQQNHMPRQMLCRPASSKNGGYVLGKKTFPLKLFNSGHKILQLRS